MYRFLATLRPFHAKCTFRISTVLISPHLGRSTSFIQSFKSNSPRRGMKYSPYLLALLAIFLMGSSGAAIKAIALPPTTFTFFRVTVPTVVLGAYFLAKQTPLFRYSVRWMLVGSTLNTARIYLYILSYSYTSIANAIIIMYSWPIFAMLLSRFFLGERIPRRNALLLMLPLGGIILIFSQQSLSWENNDFVGMSAMLASAITYSASFIIFKRESSKYGGFETVFFQNVVGSLIFLPFWLQEDVTLGSVSLLSVILFSLLIGILAFGLYFTALRSIKASTLSFISYLEVLIATTYGLLFFDEVLTWPTIVGGSLIIVSTILLKK